MLIFSLIFSSKLIKCQILVVVDVIVSMREYVGIACMLGARIRDLDLHGSERMLFNAAVSIIPSKPRSPIYS